jgi:two-component system, chemotaxis family, protein-glutamate methylesterase/glutaminase
MTSRTRSNGSAELGGSVPARAEVHTPDVVVVGASAGGVEALSELVHGLPAAFPASIFVVLHLLSTGRSMLPAILERAGSLPASVPAGEEQIERGRVYVAPPDHHLLVKHGQVSLSRGPRENGHRPAVDALFRSAAQAYGNRVIGIVLSGSQDDGTAGLGFIKHFGGIGIVQDPDEAAHPDMPANAIENVTVDHVVSVSEMPALLDVLVKRELEDQHATRGEPDPAEREGPPPRMKPGVPSPFSCPECGGVLWEQMAGNLRSYRCQVGHAYSAESLVTEQGKAVEGALWTAARSLEERAELLHRLGGRSRNRALTARFQARAGAAEDQADVLREAIESLAAEGGAGNG